MTEFLQLTFQGVALGSQYALIALGFVVIYKATGVINFAQGGFVLVGAYLGYNFTQTWDLPFYLALVMAMVAGAILGAVVERLLLRHMVGQPVFAVLMITIGLLFVLEQTATSVWGFDNLNLGDPWGIDTVKVGDLNLAVADLWTIGLAAVAMLLFFAFFRYTATGVAMRATALDQEAAVAQGISAGRIFALAWAVSGAVAALGGVTLAAGPAQLAPGISFVALAAFPAMILGGLDSPAGAVVGGIVIGVTQSLTAGYQPDHAEWLGTNFHIVMPYVVMILILLVRPYGLFGTREVRRV
ncbi:MAG TPA: branched-chain amino acid ABC transporter permease [Acidimicrobiales bacterium]|nr:branched-chain amino acid ABC transporter permease [Acidimicrobiales bacterium]